MARAKAAAKKATGTKPAAKKPKHTKMSKDGVEIMVHNNTVAAHEMAGWQVAGK